MSGDDRPMMPPVRLPAETELAQAALSAPLLARAARLARWVTRGVPVGAGGELLGQDAARAAGELDLPADEDGIAVAHEAWYFAVDTGLVEWTPVPDAELAASETAPDGETVHGTATPGPALDALTAAAPADVLEIWEEGLDAVLADASTPSFESLFSGIDGAITESGDIDIDNIDLSAMDWEPEEEAELLESALGNLYLLTATDEAVADGAMVPMPVVAASMVVPPEMSEPTDEVLEEVSATMMRLDEQFQVLLGTGMLDYDPVDEALLAPADDGDEPAPLTLEEEDLTRYGQVRLTPLGLYGVRQRMLSAGLDAAVVGDLADVQAEVLLMTLADRPESTAQEEAQTWLAAREPLEAVRELLDAARGTDPLAPQRRLTCQLVLSQTGPAADPAVREVLDDPQLGGLARVWLAERGATDVPPPTEDLVFWLTVDTIAAQLDASGQDQTELEELVLGLAAQHSGFLDKAWQVDHPATPDVLEAVGRVHPDRQIAKEARRAAYRARSRQES